MPRVPVEPARLRRRNAASASSPLDGASPAENVVLAVG